MIRTIWHLLIITSYLSFRISTNWKTLILLCTLESFSREKEREREVETFSKRVDYIRLGRITNERRMEYWVVRSTVSRGATPAVFDGQLEAGYVLPHWVGEPALLAATSPTLPLRFRGEPSCLKAKQPVHLTCIRNRATRKLYRTKVLEFRWRFNERKLDSRVDEDLREVLRFSFFLHFFICCVSQRTLYDQFRKVMQAYRYFFFYLHLTCARHFVATRFCINFLNIVSAQFSTCHGFSIKGSVNWKAWKFSLNEWKLDGRLLIQEKKISVQVILHSWIDRVNIQSVQLERWRKEGKKGRKKYLTTGANDPINLTYEFKTRTLL